MTVQYITESLVRNNTQARSKSADKLLARMDRYRCYPCFVLAPHACGQEELLKAVLEHYEVPPSLMLFEVGERGELRAMPDIEDLLNVGSIDEAPDIEKLLRADSIDDLLGEQLACDASSDFLSGQLSGDANIDPCHIARQAKTLSRSNAGGEPEDTSEERLALIPYVPWLEDDAVESFSDNVDILVKEGHQVLVFCPVQNDRYLELQCDRLEIFAFELKESGFFAPGDYASSLKEFLGASLPLKVRLTAALTAVLGQTNLDELQGLGYDIPSDLPVSLAELHPLFTTTQSCKGIQTESIDLRYFKHELFEILIEHLTEEGEQHGVAALASRMAALSIALLGRGDLEASHEVLSVAEELISTGVLRGEFEGEGGKSNKERGEWRGVRGEWHEERGEWHENRGGAALLERSSSQDFLRASSQSFERSSSQDFLRASSQGFERVSSQSLERSSSQSIERTYETMSSGPSLVRPQVPLLQLRLFGTFEVYLEGVPLDNSYLSRSKIRRLLAYLALNQQRAVLKDSLMEYLWPFLDFDRAQKNLYTSWCMLAKGLGASKVRECPYIQRNGEIYQLNPDLVVCDVRQFENIARAVLFGCPSLESQTQSLLDMVALYHDSLVADIPTDSFLSAKLESYRVMMVDALLLVTRQLRGAGLMEKALFCARTAFELDESREDVYRELMDTQLEAGQRTSAMQTYFSCKRYLSDELGILPSRSTTALYQELLLDTSR